MNKQKLLTLTDEIQRMVGELKTKLELPADTTVFYESVQRMHKAEFPEQYNKKQK